MIKRSLYVLLILSTIIAFSVLVSLKSIPNANELTTCVTSSVNKVELCPKNPDYIELKDISKVLIHAIVISEDAAFFGHEGFDWDELKNSVSKNITKGRFARGGSTITQQLAKNVFLSHEKSILRKLKEAYLAYKIEQLVSKNIILEKYLNVIELGNNIYGVKQASFYYFNKSPKDITPLEASFLAYLLPSPIKYSKIFETKKFTPFSKKRIQTILRKLKNFKRISKQESELALSKLNMLLSPSSQAQLVEYDDDNGAEADEDLHIIDDEAIDDNSNTEESEPEGEI